MVDSDSDLRAKQTGYDVATLFRVAPWIFLMGDQRSPQALVKAAFTDARGFIEAHTADPTRSRQALMRGLLINWFHAMGLNPDPGGVEMLTALVAQAVDETIASPVDDGLKGETA